MAYTPPKFKDKTLDVIYALKTKLEDNSIGYYRTLGEFYREIELLKFPYLKYCHGGETRIANEYSGKQYDTIVEYCNSMKWVSIQKVDGKTYRVTISPIIKRLGFHSHDDNQTLIANEGEKAVLLAENSTYRSHNDQPKQNILNANMELDPRLKWSIAFIDGKSYLTAK